MKKETIMAAKPTTVTELVPAKVNIDKIKLNPIAELFTVDEYLAGELKLFGNEFIEKPLVLATTGVIEEYILLTQADDYLAAKHNGNPDIDVLIVKGFDEAKLVRFIIAKNRFREYSHKQRYEIIKILLNFLLGDYPEGIAWADTLPGDINQKIAFILKVSKSTILSYRSIKDPTVLDLVDDEGLPIPFTQMLAKAKGLSAFITVDKGEVTDCDIDGNDIDMAVDHEEIVNEHKKSWFLKSADGHWEIDIRKK
jgi:hypothetical protein